MYRTLVVPLDGSTFAEQALPLAMTIARRAGSRLELVRVHTRGGSGGQEAVPEALHEQELQEARDYLHALQERLAAATGLRPAIRVLEGLAVETLYEHMLAHKANLAVMTTHGRGPLSRFWLGSVADQLVRRLPIPVVLVRSTETALDPGQETVLRHMLVALDGSQRAEAILPPVVELAQLLGVAVTLVRVVEPPATLGLDPVGFPISMPNPAVLDEVSAGARSYLEQVAGRLRGQGLNVQIRVTVQQSAAAGILDEAHSQGCDLIGLETHGRQGFSRLFLGSVADKVIRGASGAVLVHRSPES